MFPWLPFLSLHNGDPNKGPKRRRRPGSRKHSSLSSVWLNVECEESEGVGSVRVEYLPVPFQPHRFTATASSSTDLGFGSTTATVTSENRADSAPLGDLAPQNVPQQHHKKRHIRPETPSRSPRSASANNSRPGSAAAQQPPAQPINAPPPQPRTNRRGRMFETSSAMLEIFGSAPTQPQPSQVEQQQNKTSQQKEKESDSLNLALASTSVYEATIRQTAPSTSNIEQNPQVQAASVTFQQIPPTPPTVNPNDRPQFGRTNALNREGVSRTEWEPINTQTTATASSFQTIPNHDAEYERARHRGNWDGTASSFSQVNQLTQREISPMRQTEESAICPAEDELRRRKKSGHLSNGNAPESVRDASLECPLENGSITAQNGHSSTEIQQPVRRREGVAELLGGGGESMWQRERCAFRAADAAGEPSTSTNTNGVYSSKAGSSPSEHKKDEKQSNGSPVEEYAAEPVLQSADLQKPQLNGTHPPQLNGKSSEVKEKEERKKRRFVLSLAEDGSGMVAASGNGGSSDSSTTPILIRNASIVNDDAIFAADVLIADGQIRQILPGLEPPENAEIIEAEGRWLLPAGIDLHCELDNADDLSNACKDALSGGTATIVNVVKASNDNESLLTAFDRAKSLIDSKAECNVALSVQIQKWTPDVKSQVEEICQKRGVNNFVLDVQSDAELFEAMEQLKKLGALSRILPENKDIVSLLEKQFNGLQASDAYLKSRPAQLEAERIHRLCVLAQLNNAPFSVLSVGSSEACRAIQTGRQQGSLVSAEVPISALASDSLSSYATQSRIPVRSGGSNSHDALELLANGPLSVCVSDHSSIRRGKIPIGSLTVGERLQVLWEKAVASGQIDLMRFVAVTSTNAAKLFNFYPKKGRIAVGGDADLALWNGQTSHRISSRNQNEKNNFDGMTVSASPELTICAGKIVYRNGRLNVEKSKESRFVALQPNAPHVFSVVQLRDKTLNSLKPATANTRKDSAASNGSSSDNRPASQDRGSTPQNTTEKQRPITKVLHPPGGKSSGFW